MNQAEPVVMQQNLFHRLKSFLIEKKNRKIFYLFILVVVLLIISTVLIFLYIVKLIITTEKKRPIIQEKKIMPSIIVPTNSQNENGNELIQSVNYSIDCQVMVNTLTRNLSIKKLEKCGEPIQYKISPTKKFIAYILTTKNKTSQLFVYSLDNNIEALFQVISQPIIDYMFDTNNNLSLLLDKNSQTDQQTLIHYFVSLLFEEYPTNYYKELNTFTNLNKRKIETTLPENVTGYAKIQEYQQELRLLNTKGEILYAVSLNDLETELSPTKPPVINKETLKWDKRVLFFNKNQFKSIDPDGTNEIVHSFVCEGIELIPLEFSRDLITRSPDGKTIAFLVPTEDQMKDNTTWKSDILEKKKIVDQGEIILYDLVKDECQKTSIIHTIKYNETFSFSPNGLYLAYVNKGINIYNLQSRQDYQLSSHDYHNSSDGTAVTGPLIWDGESKFLYSSISKINEEQSPTATKLIRVYFNERFEGTEQEIIDLPGINPVYTVSPDGSKVLYKKDSTIIKYDVDSKRSSLFKTGASIDLITKIVWMRNNIIVSNSWLANENLWFVTLPSMIYFQTDYSGEVLMYSTMVLSQLQIKYYDLNLKKDRVFKDKRSIKGEVLRLFY